ncbi:hypothetical protein ACFZCY_43270 [Streptomyces sp. NPDC007983]|uniref:hypothetical protein n=1 Tax=Streptomyces sp. NPDC007983 TaxID=3364800 RepID=UPI0036EB5819
MTSTKKAGTSVGPRAAVESVRSRRSVTLDVAGHRVELPPKEQLIFLGGLGTLAALGAIEWPVALVIAVGHELSHSQHNEALREVGEALEAA